MGGRDSPRPNVVPPGDETWTTVGRGPRNVSVDPKRFQNIKVIYLSQYTKHNCKRVFFILISNTKKKYVDNMMAIIYNCLLQSIVMKFMVLTIVLSLPF